VQYCLSEDIVRYTAEKTSCSEKVLQPAEAVGRAKLSVTGLRQKRRKIPNHYKSRILFSKLLFSLRYRAIFVRICENLLKEA
jgi:hypothetical protein